METISWRIRLLGTLLLVAAGAYWIYEHQSKFELELSNSAIRFNNKLNDTVGAGREYRTAEQIMRSKQKRAIWPAGLGLFLLGVGWTVMPKTTAPVEAKNDEPQS
jgi:hypothetical protein